MIMNRQDAKCAKSDRTAKTPRRLQMIAGCEYMPRGNTYCCSVGFSINKVLLAPWRLGGSKRFLGVLGALAVQKGFQ